MWNKRVEQIKWIVAPVFYRTVANDSDKMKRRRVSNPAALLTL